LLGFMMTAGMQTPVASAESLKSIQAEQEAKQAELSQLNSRIGNALEEVNVLNDHLNQLDSEIKEKETEISETEEEVKEQQEIVDQRVEQAKARLLTIQTTEMNQNVLLSILEAESISDLLHRSYVLLTLQGASNQQLDEAAEEQEKLITLQEKLEDDKKIL